MDTSLGTNYILELDELRQQYEREGKFLKAQECVNRMRECTLNEGRRLQEDSKKVYNRERAELASSHQLELHTFAKKWDSKLGDYDEHAKECLVQLEQKHLVEFAEQEKSIRLHMMNKRPRFSKHVIQLRVALEKVVQQRKYIEADEIKRRLLPLEQREVEEFDALLEESLHKKTQMLKVQYQNEYAVLKQKVRLGKEELLAQRKGDYERVLHRQANAMRELDGKAKVLTSKTTDYVQRQIRVIVQNPQRSTAALQHFDPVSSMTPTRSRSVQRSGRPTILNPQNPHATATKNTSVILAERRSQNRF